MCSTCMGMKKSGSVDCSSPGVLFIGPAIYYNYDLTKALKSTKFLRSLYSNEDGTNGWQEGAGRHGFRKSNLLGGGTPEDRNREWGKMGFYQVHIDKVDHTMQDGDDGLMTSRSLERMSTWLLRDYTEWVSKYMGYQYYGGILQTDTVILSNAWSRRTGKPYSVYETGIGDW